MRVHQVARSFKLLPSKLASISKNGSDPLFMNRIRPFGSVEVRHSDFHKEIAYRRRIKNAGIKKGGELSQEILVSVRKHFESFESFVIQSGDLIREGHHRCGRRRTADVTTAANCDIRVT